MRKKILKLVGTMSAFALTLSAGIATAAVNYADGKSAPVAYAQEGVDTSVDFATDSTKWTNSTGVTIGDSGMTLGAATHAISTVAIGGNSTLNYKFNALNFGSGTERHYIMFKAKGYRLDGGRSIYGRIYN